MMVNKDDFMSRVLLYIEHEIIAPLPTYSKWGVGAMIYMSRRNSEELVDSLLSNSLFKTFGVVNTDGLINVDILCDALEESASRYGDIEINNNLIGGTLRFNKEDVKIFKDYLGGERDG